eukprot:8933719-Heterocapsa_arctica.AAC.1
MISVLATRPFASSAASFGATSAPLRTPGRMAACLARTRRRPGPCMAAMPFGISAKPWLRGRKPGEDAPRACTLGKAVAEAAEEHVLEPASVNPWLHG